MIDFSFRKGCSTLIVQKYSLPAVSTTVIVAFPFFIPCIVLSLKTKTVEGLSLEILLIEAPFKDKLMKSFLARVTFVMLNIALTVTLHCKVCFPIVAVMIAFPAFLPVTLPFLETDAIFSSDEDHFTALSVPDTFKVVLIPEGNEITVWLSFGVAALTDDESKDMADDKIKAMARNMLSVFFKFSCVLLIL